MPSESVPQLVEQVIQFGFRKLRPNHLSLDDYCKTLQGRLLCAQYSYGCLSQALAQSRDLPDEILDIALLKESESCLFFLSGCLDALGHVLNLCCDLGLSEEPAGRNRRSVAVSIGTAVQRLLTSENWKDKGLVEYIRAEWEQPWRKQLIEWRNRVTHRRIFHFVIKKDATGRAYAFLTFPDPSDPLMSLSTAGSLEVPGCFRPVMEGVERFIQESLIRLLAWADAP